MGATRTKRDTSGTPLGRTRSDTNASDTKEEGPRLFSAEDRVCAKRDGYGRGALNAAAEPDLARQ